MRIEEWLLRETVRWRPLIWCSDEERVKGRGVRVSGSRILWMVRERVSRESWPVCGVWRVRRAVAWMVEDGKWK
jgi:hypothetical protein